MKTKRLAPANYIRYRWQLSIAIWLISIWLDSKDIKKQYNFYS